MENRDDDTDDDRKDIAEDTELISTVTAVDNENQTDINTPTTNAEQRADAEIKSRRNDCDEFADAFPTNIPVLLSAPATATSTVSPDPYAYASSNKSSDGMKNRYTRSTLKSNGTKVLKHPPSVKPMRLLHGRRKKMLKDTPVEAIATTNDDLAPTRVENEKLQHAPPFEPEGQGPVPRQLTAEPLQNPSVIHVANNNQDIPHLIPNAEATWSANMSSLRSSTRIAGGEEAPDSTVADRSADYDTIMTERDFYALEAHRVPDEEQDDIIDVVDAHPVTIKWYRRHSYQFICVILALFGGILGGVIVLVSSRSGTVDNQASSAPIASPVSPAPAPITTISFTPEEIACNFLSRTSLTECRATVSFDSFSNTADTATGFTIPSEIGLLTQLTRLSLWKNELKGTIPTTLSRLTQLTHLDFSNNQLTGSIPTSLSSLTQLTAFSIATNTFSGTLSLISSLTQLTFLDVYDNRFNGTVPTTFSNLMKLQYFKLGLNTLRGTIPLFLSTLTELTYLDFTVCDFSGTIPASFSNLTMLTYLTFFNNLLTGTIPSSLSSLIKLEYLGFLINSMTGTIPSSLASLTQLTELSFLNNKLTGTIPSSFASLEKLGFVNFVDNRLTGTVPSSLCSNTTTIIVDCAEVSCDAGCCYDRSFGVCS